MSSLRKIKSYVVGAAGNPSAELKAAAVPVSEADCRTCTNPCDEGHDDYPSKFDVDMETQMLGSVKPYARQLVVSTGKADWEKEVTDAQGTLAAYLDSARGDVPKSKSKKGLPQNGSVIVPPGIHSSEDTSKVSILNGSHVTVCDDPTRETVLVFPDYKVVTEVRRSEDGARKFLQSLGRGGSVPSSSSLKTWVLPYSCVILLCSHKRRDKRCAIAAPKLEQALTTALEREGWEVHTQLEDPSLSGKPIEEISGTEEEQKREVLHLLKSVDATNADHKRALILYNSHIGGHKFSGNVIINTPQGASVWYGRVTPHEVDAIVKETIVGGKVLPPLLRGGLNLTRPGRASLHDW